MSLLALMRPDSISNWRPEPPPDLSRISELALDTETTGLRWFDGDRMIGLALAWREGNEIRSQYLPVRHSGGNLDEGTVLRWMERELREKWIYNLHMRFDTHVLFQDDIDLEEQGCRISDVGGWAGLLDEMRHSYSLESLAQADLGEGKVKARLDMNNLAQYHAGEVESYARQDAVLALKLKELYWPQLDQQGLHEVRQLEDDVLYPVCHMERNGAPIDKVKLGDWLHRSKVDLQKCLWEIRSVAGMTVNPKSPKDMAKLFRKLELKSGYRTLVHGNESYGDIALSEIDHPVIRLAQRARRLESLRSKFLMKYWKELERFDVLWYSLHPMSSDEGGAKTGRFSCSEYRTGKVPDGINAQQVFTPEKQEKKGLGDYVVRELYIPGSGFWLAADAMQIEYRLFAHFAKPPDVIAAYRKDPMTDFHNIVMQILKEVRPDITRKETKDVNFAKIFGAGLGKIADMIHMSEEETKKFVAAYDRRFPEIPRLARKASRAAEQRGYVRTIMGRRRRFPGGEFTHKALNAVIQGSAADYNKLKIVELHRERKYTNLKMRFTVHDEVDGDVPDIESVERVREVLNRQHTFRNHDTGEKYQLAVPILWDVGAGANWKEAK